MADGNQTIGTVLASLLGAAVGAVAGSVVTRIITREPEEDESPRAQLIPLEGKGHFYTGPSNYCWADDLCLYHLFPSAKEVREVAGGYSFSFPNNELAWFRHSSLTAPGQVGRLFEVKGGSSVHAVLKRCAILAGSGQAEEMAVRFIGATITEYERQVEAEMHGQRVGGRR